MLVISILEVSDLHTNFLFYACDSHMVNVYSIDYYTRLPISSDLSVSAVEEKRSTVKSDR